MATQPTDVNPRTYLESVPNERRRHDALTLLDLIQDVTAAPAVMWGPGMVGFGSYPYTYASGREGDWFVARRWGTSRDVTSRPFAPPHGASSARSTSIRRAPARL